MQLGFWPMAQQYPDKIAVVEPEGREITFRELLSNVNKLVHGLRKMGLQPGDAVATCLRNDSSMLEVYMAAAQAGWYITPINVHLTSPEIAYILGDCGAKAFFASERYADAVKGAVKEINFPAAGCFSTGKIDGFQSYDSLKAGQPDTTPEGRRFGAPMTYTSGTTGQPKGVRRPLADFPPETVASQQAGFLMLFGIQPVDGVHLVVSPLYHTAVLNFCTNHMHMGHTIVLMDKWTPEGTLEKIQKYKVTNSHMVPTHFNRMLNLPEDVRNKYDVTSLRHIIHSAAPCPVPVKQKMLAWWGKCIYEYYAASEGGGTLATPDQWLAHPGTVGLPWPISKISVRREDGSECKPGEVGTVYISMGQHKFEYHKDKDKTNKAWKDDFFTVGDAGYMSEDGFLFLSDRKADMIISGGVNIYPAEIESTMITHPKIGDVAVFGIPDDDWGEQVKAVVEPKEGITGSKELADDIFAYLKDKLAGYKMPKTIDFTEALPRDPNGKLYKRKLRDPYWAGREKAI